MRSSMVAHPSAVAALQSLHTLPDHTSPSTSNTRRTPRRTLAEHLAEHSPNTSAPPRPPGARCWPRARLCVAGTPAAQESGRAPATPTGVHTRGLRAKPRGTPLRRCTHAISAAAWSSLAENS